MKNNDTKIKVSNSMKEEIARELGVDLKRENITAKEAGKVGGEITRRLIEAGKKNL